MYGNCYQPRMPKLTMKGIPYTQCMDSYSYHSSKTPSNILIEKVHELNKALTRIVVELGIWLASRWPP